MISEVHPSHPEIFAGLPLAYGETHRIPDGDPLSGNTSHSAALEKVYPWLDNARN
jgi:hypothetical protein